ncbi:MAG: gamma-glutamyl-gamma-aminobutyrate hydrolase family protein [Ruminococcaceae bacterium]|nr:gamma-glutamyl-gamma-aminobutyrate hydrolase family protein [Oscillospiraceae bacterium]
MTPLIGITPAVGENGALSLQQQYCTAVLRLGGFPVILPSYGDPAEALQRCDGLLISGGPDIDPAQYGVSEYDREVVVLANPIRDAYELTMAKLAYERGIPMLGICRGEQIINVALGGTLVIDLPGHRQETERHLHHHTVTVAPDSRLHAIVGQTVLPVNSTHHQAVNEPAPCLRVTAASPEGIREAVESAEHPFCLGVQWHPERLLADDPAARPIAALIEAARK